MKIDGVMHGLQNYQLYEHFTGWRSFAYLSMFTQRIKNTFVLKKAPKILSQNYSGAKRYKKYSGF